MSLWRLKVKVCFLFWQTLVLLVITFCLGFLGMLVVPDMIVHWLAERLHWIVALLLGTAVGSVFALGALVGLVFPVIWCFESGEKFRLASEALELVEKRARVGHKNVPGDCSLSPTRLTGDEEAERGLSPADNPTSVTVFDQPAS